MLGVIDDNRLLDCLKLMLRPVVRFAIRRSLSVQDLVESTKIVCIEVAAEELERREEKVNISRLRVVTGMHRRDVVRLYREKGIKTAGGNLIAKVIGQWQFDRRFATKGGAPRVLSHEGEDCEFNRLVRTVSVDVHPASVLFELERLGAIDRTKRGLRLMQVGYLPSSKDPRDVFKLLARDADDMICAIEENVFNDPAVPNLHVQTEYDNISAGDLLAIRKWLFQEGSRFHKKVRHYLAKFDLDLNPSRRKEGGGRVVIGCFTRAQEPSKWDSLSTKST